MEAAEERHLRVQYNGRSALEQCMTLCLSCARMHEIQGDLQAQLQAQVVIIHQLTYDLQAVRHELIDMQEGMEEMRVSMEDGVALVCVCMQLRVASCHVGCACS